MSRLLVTGGCGFIGSNFIRWLLEDDPAAEIVNLDKLTYAGNPENLASVSGSGRYEFRQGDIGDRAVVEASGGINLETVRAVAETGVDLISVGGLTHSVTALDISLDLEFE